MCVSSVLVLLERSPQYLFFSRLFQRGEIDFLLKSEIYKLSDLVVKQCYFNITVKKMYPVKHGNMKTSIVDGSSQALPIIGHLRTS